MHTKERIPTQGQVPHHPLHIAQANPIIEPIGGLTANFRNDALHAFGQVRVLQDQVVGDVQD